MIRSMLDSDWIGDYAERLFARAQDYRLAGLPAHAWGRGPLVLLVHGRGATSARMAPLVDPLVWSGRRVVAIDLAWPRSSVAQAASALARAAEELGRVHAVVAHSLGAFAAVHAMRSGALRADRAVLLAPVARVPSDDRRDAARAAAGLVAPALVVQDVSDASVPGAHAVEIAASWGGARFESAPRLWGSANVVQRVIAFLDRQAAGQPELERLLFERDLRGVA